MATVQKDQSQSPTWFSEKIQIPETLHQDLYACTRCGGQSCGGVYASTCHKCKGLITNPPSGKRVDYLCFECITAQRKHFCKCDYLCPALVPPKKKLPNPCCCTCDWCNYMCRCICCCWDCKWMTSSCHTCCISRCSCPCCKFYWSWCGCSCSQPIED